MTGASSKRGTVVDTSVLINFIVVDRLELLWDHPILEFGLPDQVIAEISEDYPDERERLEVALDSGLLRLSAETTSELAAFASFTRDPTLGPGECDAIAIAASRGMALAIDDRRAMSAARAFAASLEILTTADIVRSAIAHGRLNVAEADALKARWEEECRFRLPFASFGDSE